MKLGLRETYGVREDVALWKLFDESSGAFLPTDMESGFFADRKIRGKKLKEWIGSGEELRLYYYDVGNRPCYGVGTFGRILR